MCPGPTEKGWDRGYEVNYVGNRIQAWGLETYVLLQPELNQLAGYCGFSGGWCSLVRGVGSCSLPARLVTPGAGRGGAGQGGAKHGSGAGQSTGAGRGGARRCLLEVCSISCHQLTLAYPSAYAPARLSRLATWTWPGLWGRCRAGRPTWLGASGSCRRCAAVCLCVCGGAMGQGKRAGLRSHAVCSVGVCVWRGGVVWVLVWVWVSMCVWVRVCACGCGLFSP